MTPHKHLRIIHIVTALAKHKKAMDEYMGRTVPAIREGGSFDGRAIVAGDADGFRFEGMRKLGDAQ